MVVAAVSAQLQTFHADFQVSNDPALSTGAIVFGQIYYDFPGDRMMLHYNPNPNFYELYLYNAQLRYQVCGTSCDGVTYKIEQPYYFNPTGIVTGQSWSSLSGSIQSLDGRTCSTRLRANPSAPITPGVYELYLDSSNRPCRAIENSGRTIDFTNVVSGIGSVPYSWSPPGSCPTPTCEATMDLCLVIDESGSISPYGNPSEWSLVIGFSVDVVNSFAINANAVNVGISFFSSNADVDLWLNADRTTVVNTLNNHPKAGGGTCIGCGMHDCNTILGASSRSVPRVMMVLTDGGNNVGSMGPPRDAAFAAGTEVFAIGVDGYVQSQLNFIATDPDSTHVFAVSNFAQLSSVIAALTVTVCQDLPGSSCNTGCVGLCNCGSCGCPPSCDDSNACTTESCTPSGTSQCVYTPVSCNDNNACTIDTCNPASGCVYTPVTVATYCDDNNDCTTDTCTPAVGCQHTPISCDDNDACTIDTCAAVGGCQYTPVNCDDSNDCTTEVCDTTNGCQYTPVNCDDSNACTVDVCNVVGGCDNSQPTDCDDGNACTDDSCIPASGCQHTPTNCDDSDVCTADSCNTSTGCINTPIQCDLCMGVVCTGGDLCDPEVCDPADGICKQNNPVVCDDNNACTTDSCNLATGNCDYVPTTCGGSVCTPEICNPATGVCDQMPVDCDDSNPCTDDSCIDQGGAPACVNAPVSCSQADPCNPEVCNPSNGNCEVQPVDCDDNNPCSIDTCIAGTCDYTAVDCDDGNPCTVDSCNPATGGCVNAAVNGTLYCDDSSACTIDTCDPTATAADASPGMPAGCRNTVVVCDDGDSCTDDTCDAILGCQHQTRVCASIDACHIARCDDTLAYAQACVQDEIPGTLVCGQCGGNRASCSFDNLSRDTQIGVIAGGVVAGIVLGILAAIALGIFATKKTYDWASHRNKDLLQNSRANPAFQENENRGVNPLAG